jgi:NADPH2:quinone reductase
VDLMHRLCADHVIDYRRTDFTQGTQRYDVIFSTVGHTTYAASKHLLKEKGRYVTSDGASSDYWHMLRSKLFGGHKVIGGVSGGAEEGIQELRALIEAGELRAVIDRHYPLQAIVEAHRYVEQGHKKGNVVIDVAA